VTSQRAPEGPNHLHGGSDGLHRKRWIATEVSSTAVTFVYLSLDGESGYPGSVAFSVKYELVQENQLCVTMRGRVLGDLQTPINLAQHTYFNLAGHASGRDVLGHELRMDADAFLDLDASQIPTGVRQSVDNPACMDFRRGKMIGAGIEAVPGCMGYDHNYCFSVDGVAREVREVAELRDPQSGRIMVVSTDAPGAQLYALKCQRLSPLPFPSSFRSLAVM
jgi:aldose 1-epimerase